MIRDPKNAWSRRLSGSAEGSALADARIPRAERNRELQQREGVPLCLDQDTLANGRRELGEPAVEQLPCCHIIEPREI